MKPVTSQAILRQAYRDGQARADRRQAGRAASAVLLGAFMLAGLFMFGFWSASVRYAPAVVGGTSVPAALHCEEDELIGFVGIDRLGCVHWESILVTEVE